MEHVEHLEISVKRAEEIVEIIMAGNFKQDACVFEELSKILLQLKSKEEAIFAGYCYSMIIIKHMRTGALSLKEE